MSEEYNLKKYRRTGTMVGDALAEVMDHGKKAFHDDKFRSPYASPTHPFYAVYIHAWVAEDLRQALIKANPVYARSQQVMPEHEPGKIEVL